MAITRAALTSGGTTTDAASFATAAVTPTASEVVVVTVSNTKTSGVGSPDTVSGGGITFTKAVEKISGSRCVSIWTGQTASPSNGAITADFGANTQTACAWTVEQTTGADPSNPVVQTGTGSGTNTTGTLTASLAALRDENSLLYYVVNHAANEVTSPATSWTEIQDTALASPSVATESAYISGSGNLNPGPTWSTSSAYAMAAVEIGVTVASTGVIAMLV